MQPRRVGRGKRGHPTVFAGDFRDRTPAVSRPLSDQHAHPARRDQTRSDPRRYPRRTVRPIGDARLRHHLDAWRLADGSGRTKDFAARTANGFRVIAQDLPDVKEDDICGSPFAVQDYTAQPRFRRRGGAWPGCASVCTSAACVSCSTSCPTTRRSIIPGRNRTPSFMCPAARRTWPANRTTGVAFRADRRAHPGSRPRSVLSRLARHLATQLSSCRIALRHAR